VTSRDRATPPPLEPDEASTAAADDAVAPQPAPSDEVEHGRIGYGRYGRYTPVALAMLLVASLVGIGLTQNRENDNPRPARLVDRPAPVFTLSLLDGATLRLAELRGSVVVLNFWASWCGPCRIEAPALQTLQTEAIANRQPVVVVGVGLKNDGDEPVRTFVEEYRLTYPIGRDTAGGDPIRGPIEQAYELAATPSTVIIRPDGTISAVHLGQVSTGQLAAYVAAAAGTSNQARTSTISSAEMRWSIG